MWEPWRSVGVASSTPSAPARQVRGEERRAVVGRPGGRGEAAALQPRPRVALAVHAAQRRLDEDAEADDRRQRVAGQAEHERVVAAPEPQRLARLDPHAPEDLVHAAGLEGRLDVVVLADRHAAADDQHVAAEALAHGRDRRRAIVADDAVVADLGARARGEQAHHQPVGLVHSPGLGRRAGRQQLVRR